MQPLWDPNSASTCDDPTAKVTTGLVRLRGRMGGKVVQGPNGLPWQHQQQFSQRGETYGDRQSCASKAEEEKIYVSTAWILVSLVCSLVKQRPATCLQFGAQLFQLGLQAGSWIEDPEMKKAAEIQCGKHQMAWSNEHINSIMNLPSQQQLEGKRNKHCNPRCCVSRNQSDFRQIWDPGRTVDLLGKI